MKKIQFAFNLLAISIISLCCVSIVQAQATRTWVSGLGDDANPCSRTAPCKTFAGAISKTATNGEIDALDPGGFGTVTITKSITIDGTCGSGFGSILASGTTGVVINIATSVSDPLRVVRLRNLSINGTGTSGGAGTRTGIIGVRIISADQVYIENTVITDFSQRGISDERTTGGRLYVTDSIVRNSGQSGVVILPSSGATTIKAILDNVRSEGNVSSGFVASSGSRVTIRNSIASNNGSAGFAAEGPAGASEMNLENCTATGNGTGVQNGAAGSSTTRLSNCDIFNNTVGLSNTTGSILSFGNNKIGGNGSGNTGVTAANPGVQ